MAHTGVVFASVRVCGLPDGEAEKVPLTDVLYDSTLTFGSLLEQVLGDDYSDFAAGHEISETKLHTSREYRKDDELPVSSLDRPVHLYCAAGARFVLFTAIPAREYALADLKAAIAKCEPERVATMLLAARGKLAAEVAKDTVLDSPATVGGTALHWACMQTTDDAELVRVLVDAGAGLDTRTKRGFTPLFAAADKGLGRIAELLVVQLKADVNATNTEQQQTALLQAASLGHEAIARMLCDAKAELNLATSQGCTPLFMAAQRGHASVVRLLCGRGADPNAGTTSNGFALAGVTPLIVAVSNGREDVVAALVEAKCDVDQGCDAGTTALHFACAGGRQSIATILLRDGGADVDGMQPYKGPRNLNQFKLDIRGEAPAVAAVKRCDVAMVRLLCEHGTDLARFFKNGSERDVRSGVTNATLLFHAAEHGNTATVAALLDAKAEVDKGHDNGNSPLLIAGQEHRSDICALLLDRKADVNYDPTEEGATPIVAVAFNWWEGPAPKSTRGAGWPIMQMYARRGADLDMKYDGKTLEEAMRESEHGRSDQLPYYQSWLTAFRNFCSPLHGACEDPDNPVAAVRAALRAEGCYDVRVRTGSGHTPLDLVTNAEAFPRSLVCEGAAELLRAAERPFSEDAPERFALGVQPLSFRNAVVPELLMVLCRSNADRPVGLVSGVVPRVLSFLGRGAFGAELKTAAAPVAAAVVAVVEPKTPRDPPNEPTLAMTRRPGSPEERRQRIAVVNSLIAGL